MTVEELLTHKKTTYLFNQNGWRFYACGSRFYKVFKEIILPADFTKEG